MVVLMNKKTYDEYRELIVQKNDVKLQKRIRELNELLLADYLHDYFENSGRGIEKQLENTERFKQMSLPAVNSKISYQIGFFMAILNVFELLVYRSKKRHSFEVRIKAMSEKANVNKILDYLYFNPDSQHKVIAENTQLKANYLSELMRELENAGCVERYGVGKRSFYSLSLKANEFMKKQQKHLKHWGWELCFHPLVS